MRSILALSLLIALCGVANAAPLHHRHKPLASSFAYAPSRPPLQDRSGTPDCDKPEPYFGACQGYAPGEKERFLNSLHGP
ncbi:hypothetical protein JQ612_34925 [Bradyrhizobium manausense]|uniref:hypothetical protein n=1 Tax=Bradyrhizobium manausense TaxID=989370 RepID=UPI001BA44EE7|nr:hypothetical protein [Bradyrhizobium manausense]MBR0685088.1 hypothetical protein [Bradyrhizobium manausense]MBR0726461.1 hypothetical protein [Bradyrhizobium manausense]MBR0838422.1 hypothetical protein [Bradyrhizobium manausense]